MVSFIQQNSIKTSKWTTSVHPAENRFLLSSQTCAQLVDRGIRQGHTQFGIDEFRACKGNPELWFQRFCLVVTFPKFNIDTKNYGLENVFPIKENNILLHEFVDDDSVQNIFWYGFLED